MGRMNTHKMPAMPRPTALIPGLVLASLLATGLTGCGQKGPLFIPQTPAAAQRSTLPQTLLNRQARAPTPPASEAPAATPPPALPNLPATGTPLPAQQSLDADCYRDGAGGVYCFVPIANTGGEPLENVSALVTLTDSASGQVYQQSAVLPLNILPAGKTLPAVTYFMPPTPAEFSAAATLEFSLPVTNWHLRYADAAVVGPKTTISDDGNQAEVSGSIFFADKERPVSSVWVVGVAYTEDGRVAGLRRWEAVPPIRVSQNLPFRFLIFNAADAPIAEVELFVEARPVLP